MSLQIWLPLTKDLRNQGLNNVTVTNNGATFNSNGKLGGAYSFNGSSNYLTISQGYPGANWSYSVWAYTTSSSATQTLGCCRAAVGTGFSIFLIGGKIRIDPGANQVRWTTNYTYPVNTWFHFTVTCNNGAIKYYINGEYKESYSTTLASNQWGSIFSIGASQSSGSDYDNFLNGKLNDIRIYDHCLSPMEVKELSKGLVLHYPLNRQGWGQENLILNSNTFAVGGGATGITPSTTAEGYHQVIAASGNSNWHASWATATSTSLLENTFAEGDPFTISFTIKSENANVTQPPNIYVKSGMGYYAMKGNVTSDWSTIYYSGTWKDTNAIAFHLGFAGLVGTYLFKNWKVEKGSIPTPWCPNSADTLADTIGLNSNIEYDTSGFNNNGTKIGTLTYTSDTPKYEVSTHIGSTSSKIHISNFPTSGFGNTYSFAWWGKRPSNSPMFWGFSDGIRLNGMYIGTLWNTGDGSNNPLYKIGTTTQVTAPSTGIWHHYVMTGNGTKCYVYLDGELWAEAKTYKAISGTSIYINGWDSSTQYCSEYTDISDFRIYATALSADDVKSLYQNCATIGADGKIYGQIRA